MNYPSTPWGSISRLDEVYNRIAEASHSFIGYPCTGEFNYTELYDFLNYPINNVGDPFVRTNYHLNTHEVERDVLNFFADIMHAGDNFWGYVTNGGTEGNLYGLYLARELYPEGLVYHSQDVHYSVSKSLRLLRMKSIMIRSQKNGEMDYEDLKETIKIKRDTVPIIFATIGTTMKAAIDNIAKIRKVIEECAIPECYIHCDAALSGMILPFVDGAPGFDFAAGADSIAISGHKFIGSPIPCGVALAKRNNVERITKFIEYVGSLDTTITGSRNGVTPLFLWHAIKKFGIEGFKRRVRDCLDVARYTAKRLNDLGLNAWRNDFATTVVFDRPAQQVIEKWQLAPQGDITHVILMPGVTRERIDCFIDDLKRFV